MTPSTALDLPGRFRLASKACTAGAVALGIVTLGSWKIETGHLQGIHPALAAMQTHAAVWFVCVVVGANVGALALVTWWIAGSLQKSERERARGFVNLSGPEREPADAMSPARETDVLRQSEERLRLVLNGLGPHMLVGLLDTRGVVLMANQPALDGVALEAEEVVGKLLDDTASWSYSDAVRRRLRAAIDSVAMGHSVRYDEQISVTEGQLIWIDFSLHPLRDLSGAVAFLVPSAIVISERKQAEEAVREQTDLLLNAQRIGRMGSWSLDLRTGRLLWPQATCDLFGIAPEEFAGTSEHFRSFVLPEDLPVCDAALARATPDEPLLEVEYRIRRPDGVVRCMYGRGHVEYDGAGTPVSQVGMVVDITEQREARQQLEENAALLRIAGRVARLGGWTIQLPERTLTWSDENCAIHDVPPGHRPTLEEGIGYFPPEYREQVGRYVDACGRDGTPYDFELPKITAKGRHIWVRSIGEAVRDGEGRVTRIQGAFQDITERRLAEESLRERETELRTLTDRRQAEEQVRLAIEASPIGMLMIDPAGQIVLVNRQIEQMFGYQRIEIIGHAVETLVPHRFRRRLLLLRTIVDPGERITGAGKDLFGLRHDGTEVPIEIDFNPIEAAGGRFVLGSVVDVTERKRAEQERNGLVTELEALTRSLEERVEDRTREARDSEERYRALFDDSPISLWETDCSGTAAFVRDLQASIPGDVREYLSARPDLIAAAAATVRIVAVNRRTLELFEALDKADLVSHLQTADAEVLAGFHLRLLALLDGVATFEIETVQHTVKGRRLLISLRQKALPGCERTWSRVVVSMIDITASKNAEALLLESVHQQEVLLKEIHHRVKNNLAVISSLFYLESTYATDERAVRVFEETQRRVRSMALVHETLYGSGNLAAIDFAEYARVLAAEALASYRLPERRVRLKTDLQAMKMSIDLAVPCGLILNELISNAFKHSFAGDIAVTIRHGAGRTGIIQVADDGVGVPADLNIETNASLGLRLIHSLVRQIRGTFELLPGNPGTEARITFALEEHG